MRGARGATPWMPLRTRLLHQIMRAGRRPERVLEPRELAWARAAMPMRPPTTWIVGAVAKGLGQETVEVPARDGHPLRVVVHRPTTPGSHPLLIHFHGGGFAIGSLELYQPWCSQVAHRADVVVATVDYRMAPEHLAPTAAHDAIDAATWLIEHADRLGARRDAVGVAGDSAGGNLATVVAQHLRDRGETALRHQALIYPAPDLTEREIGIVERRYPVLSRELAGLFRTTYLGEAGDPTDPLISPAHGRLDGLPPTLIQVAEIDPLRDDGEAYAAALTAAGVEVRLSCYRGAPHGFATLPGLTTAGYPSLEELSEEVAHHLHAGRRAGPTMAAALPAERTNTPRTQRTPRTPMKRPYAGMARRTQLVTWYLDNAGRSITDATTTEQIQELRAQVFPARAPFTWITGPVAAGVEISQASLPVRDRHEVPLRWYLPSSSQSGAPAGATMPLVVFFHGGGWVRGSTRMYDPLCSRLAAAVPAAVVSVDYRMAPEHAAPTAAYDAIDITRALVEAKGGWPSQGDRPPYDPGRVAVAGDSAGGNLAAVVAQQLRGLTGPGGEPAIRHQALIYPATDLTFGSPSIEEHADGAVLTRESMEIFRRLYLAGDLSGERMRDPLVSPLFGDVAGVAPALVQTADLDPIRDDGTRYADALRAAGVPVRATNYLRLPHGFASMPGASPTGRQSEAELVDELRRHLAAGGRG